MGEQVVAWRWATRWWRRCGRAVEQVVELEEREKKWEEGKKSRAARKGRILKPNINNHEWVCKIKPDWFHSSFQTHTKILTKRGLSGIEIRLLFT